MKKVASYIKPYLVLVFATIALLFVQSFADLKLPNYVSNIVDVGIQQSGIVESSPETMTLNAMELVTSILPEEPAREVKSQYELKNDRYVLREGADRDALNRLMGETVWTMMNFNPDNDSSFLGGEDGKTVTVDDLMPMVPMLKMMDPAVKEAAYEKALTMEPSLIVQSANVMARMFYVDAGYDLQTIQRNYILETGMKMMGITMIGAVAAVIVIYLSSKIGAGLTRDLRRGVFTKVQDFSSGEFDTFSSSSLVVRTTNDITQIQQLFTFGMRIIVSAPIMAIGGIIMIQNHNTNMTWIIIVACAVLMALFIIIFTFVVPKFKKMQEFIDKLNLIIRENLSGIMVIRAFDNQKFEGDRFDKANKDHADILLFVGRVMTLMMPLLMFIMNITMLAILWFGANGVANGALQIGDMMAFMQYAMQIISSFLMIAMMFVFIPRAMVSINRVSEILETESTITNPTVPASFIADQKGVVSFDHVSFKYKDAAEYVLEDISFVAKPGQTTAIIGSTGSGKSTLVKLVMRFFDATTGSIEVNGVNVQAVNQEDLREEIGYIPQKAMLLSGDVRSNVSYGNDAASDAELEHALQIAQGQFVLDNEQGMGMAIAQDATNVSGGQKQRISIARAVAKEAQILIFDDSFSALDFKTDLTLRQELKKNLSGATMIIVAQRINTIMDADQILVLEEGRIVGHGRHDELLKTCDTYYQIALSQLSEEELSHE